MAVEKIRSSEQSLSGQQSTGKGRHLQGRGPSHGATSRTQDKWLLYCAGVVLSLPQASKSCLEDLELKVPGLMDSS